MKNFLIFMGIVAFAVLYFTLAMFTYAFIPTTLVFMTLKLCNVIMWGWFYVIGLPIIIGFCATLMFSFIRYLMLK